MKYDICNITVRKRDRLPHWDVQHGIYFVTFNLFDALPQRVLLQVREEADARIAHIQHLRGTLTIAEKRGIDEWVQAKIGDAFAGSHGACFMRDYRIAKVVADAITFFDRQRYVLFAWSVMPNHVHVVFTLCEGHRLDGVIHSWKSFSAKRANELLGREGRFWQDGYYDRTVRDARELAATIDYVVRNPAKAGLRDWPFVAVHGERIPPAGTAGGGERDARTPLRGQP